MRYGIMISVAGAVLVGCATAASTAEDRTRAEDADSFAAHVVEDIEAHAWQNLLAASDPTHFQARVVDARVSEVEYLAELLGLAASGNMIQEGDTLDWPDLERIEEATLAPAGSGVGPPFRYAGQAVLATGERLRLDVRITQVQGRFVLTGPTS